MIDKDERLIQEIIDLLNGPDCPDILTQIAERDNLVYLLEQLISAYAELDNTLTQIHDLT